MSETNLTVVKKYTTCHPDFHYGKINWELMRHPDGHHRLHKTDFCGPYGISKLIIFIGCTREEAIIKADELIKQTIGL